MSLCTAHNIHTSHLLFLLLLLASGCNNRPVHPPIPVDRMVSGDIVFRCGSTIQSRMVLLTNPRDGRYSHIGIAVEQDGRWYVIHAVPHEPDFDGDIDRVKMEPLKSFFKGSKAVRAAVMRVECTDSVRHKVVRHAICLAEEQRPFDNKYDISDTTALYCTELIDYIFREAGINLREQRYTPHHYPLVPDTLLFPDDIMNSPLLTPVFSY